LLICFNLYALKLKLYNVLMIVYFYVIYIFVDTQFPIGDVARLLNSWVDCSERECLHKEEDNRVEERPEVSWRVHSDA
jgi:hypothetical protein